MPDIAQPGPPSGSLFATMPLPARRTDPTTSHTAARKLVARGGRETWATRIMSVMHHEYVYTSAEIARNMGVEIAQVNKRLTEMERVGLVIRCAERECRETGNPAATWKLATGAKA